MLLWFFCQCCIVQPGSPYLMLPSRLEGKEDEKFSRSDGKVERFLKALKQQQQMCKEYRLKYHFFNPTFKVSSTEYRPIVLEEYLNQNCNYLPNSRYFNT